MGGKTELPFISINAEMWRGFRDLGEALSTIGKQSNRQHMSALGAKLSAEAPAILSDLRASMALDVSKEAYPRCHPYVAHIPTCGQLPGSSRSTDTFRDSEPWKTCKHCTLTLRL